MGKVNFKHCDKRRGKPRAPVSMAQLAREGRLAPRKPGKKLFNTVQGALNELNGLLRANQKIRARLARLKTEQSRIAIELDPESDVLTHRRMNIERDLTVLEQRYEDLRVRILACRAILASRI